jgi:hypothetical protein
MKTIITAIVALVLSTNAFAEEKVKHVESFSGGITSQEIHELVQELETVLEKDQDSGFTSEEEEAARAEFEALPAVTKLDALEKGKLTHQAVRGALLEGVIVKASGVTTPVVTPRVAEKRELRNTDLVKLAKAEREVESLLNPSLWERVTWWWNN